MNTFRIGFRQKGNPYGLVIHTIEISAKTFSESFQKLSSLDLIPLNTTWKVITCMETGKHVDIDTFRQTGKFPDTEKTCEFI